MAKNDLTVKVTGDTTSYERAMTRAASASDKYRDSLTSLELSIGKLEREMAAQAASGAAQQEAAFKKQTAAAAEVGKTMMAAGAAIGVGLGLAAKAAVDWETSWAGVTKTISGTPAQFDVLEGQLRDMAKTLPASHDQIAAVAEAAGQLGVKTSDIAKFTKVMIAMGTSTNLTADEAATSMARFSNIMSEPIKNVDRLGATIVALGNNGASTEAEIVAMGLRIAAAGRQVGLSSQQVLALANAMSSMGIEAEAGGTAMSQTLVLIDRAVANGSGTLKGFASLAGMTASQFQTAWRKDATSALLAFERGLGKVKTSGGNVFDVLEKLGITGVRQRDTVLRLAGGVDVLSDSLKTGDSAWRANTALMNEANKRYETTASRVQIAQNQITDFAITIGDKLLPVIAKVLGFVSSLIDLFSSLPAPVQTGVLILGTLAGVIGLVGGAALVAGPKIAAFKQLVADAGGAGNVAKRGLSGIAGFLTGPWGIALSVAAVGIGYFAQKHEEAQQRVQALSDTLDDATGAITDETNALIANQLEQDGVLEAGKALGLSLKDITDAASGNEPALKRVNEQLAQLRPALDTSAGGDPRLARDFFTVKDAISGANKDLTDAIAKHQRLQDATGKTSDKTSALGDAANAAGVDMSAFADDVDPVAAALKDLSDRAKTVNDALEILNGTMDNQEAASNYQAAIDDVTDRLSDYHKAAKKGSDGTKGMRDAFDLNTKAGRDNAASLRNLWQRSGEYAEQIYKTGGNQAQANRILQQGRAQLVDMATKFLGSRKKAEEYVTTVLGIPKNVSTQFHAPGLEPNKKDAADYSTILKGIPKGKSTKWNTPGLSAALTNTRALARAAQDASGTYRMEFIRIYTTQVRQTKADRATARGGGRSQRAAGGPVEADVPYTVGEAGRELFVPEQDGYIVPHTSTEALLGNGQRYGGRLGPAAAGGAGEVQPVVINIHEVGVDRDGLVRELERRLTFLRK